MGVVDVHFLKEHPGHILFQGPGHIHWISEDYGKTYTAVDTPGSTLGYGRCGEETRLGEPCCTACDVLTMHVLSMLLAEEGDCVFT